nr:molybdopterin-dependent oxidoreductase [Ktedonobacterales bacterium]
AGVSPLAREIVITGADGGQEPEASGTRRYVRSLPIERAMHTDTLLAYAMNGERLSPEHGFPARLVVAGWYGMAAVKWVVRIEASTEAFRGFYQADRYIMRSPTQQEHDATPLTLAAVRSLIAQPTAAAQMSIGAHVIRGFAWSGAALITQVEVSVDDGQSWERATLASEASRYAWRRWEYVWRATAVGPVCLKSRATDAEGNVQPEEPVWNRLGYANNAIQAVRVTVI